MPTQIALATKHGKLEQIAPAFEFGLGFELVLADTDTDRFGTFSGEIPRTLNPKDAAVAKARAGALELGLDYGLASEGSIGAHPQFPWVNSDQEILALVCLSGGFSVIETYLSTDIVARSKTFTSVQDLPHTADLAVIADEFDLPNHAVIVSAFSRGELHVEKGIREVDYLLSRITLLLESGVSEVRVESDFRAMMSPSRQRNIAQCAERLVARIASRCPDCNEIGWGRIGFEYGLPCGDCFEMVDAVPHSERLGCVVCDHVEIVSLGVATIDASRCDLCNP